MPAWPGAAAGAGSLRGLSAGLSVCLSVCLSRGQLSQMLFADLQDFMFGFPPTFLPLAASRML